MARLRLPLAIALGWCTSVGLFWSLRTLIGASGAFDEIQPAPKIEKPAPPPEAPAVMASEKASVVPGADIAALAPSVDFSGLGSGGGAGFASELSVGAGVDRDAVPQVRIEPDYPIQARQKRIEGWVDVEFTVGADGSVRDPVVLDADPKTIFDRAALQAIKGWKYNPKIEDGRPVERQGLRVRIRFTLES